MTCTDCKSGGADCLTADRVRVCSDCLYERVVKERDEARAALAAELPAAWREDIESLNECLERVGRERDEARAEVERLKAQMEAEAKDYTQDDVNRMTDEMIALRKDYEKAAYQRGAEAMREAAARLVDDRLSDKLTDAAKRIREMPTPEINQKKESK